MKKVKANIVRNFLYSLKKVYSVDKGYVFKSLISTILRAINTFMYPYILKTAVEGIEQKKEFSEIVFDVLIIICIAFVTSLLTNLISNDFWHRNRKISVLLTREFYFNSLNADYEKFERTEAQDAFEKASRALNNYSGITGLVSNVVRSLSFLLTFFIACSIIFSVSIWLIIAIVSLAILKLVLENYKQVSAKKYFYDKTPQLWRRINYTDNISRNLTIGKDLRIYEMNKFIDNEREAAINEYMKYNKSNEKRIFIISVIINVLRVLDELFLYGFMIYEVIYNGMSLATFTFMVSSVRTLTNSISGVIGCHGQIINCSLVVNDYIAFSEYDLNVDTGNEELSELNSIEFKNVSYSYYMQDGYALKNVSFKISKGERIALVGYNGAGKTTLIKLLCGLYHPTEGEILLNGISIENISRQNLSNLIAPVFQDVMHYAIEIGENVSMKHSDDTDCDKVMDILRLVELDKKIDNLPNRLKTIITRDLDDNGVELSGGENQKLSLARAIYKKSPLIILDEPTSALDAIAEHNLYSRFNEIIDDSMAIFISHRLSSTRFCDRIFLLDEGELLEVGTHDELMSKETKYKELFNMQAEYYKGGEPNEA